MGLPLITKSFYDNGGGLNTKYSPTKVPEDEASLSLNIDYSVDGAFLTRNGTSIMNVSGVPPIPAQMSGAPKTLLLFDYKKSDGTGTQVIAAGTTLKASLTTPANAVTGISGLLPYPDMEFFVTGDDEYLIWGNGVDENLKFNGTTWTNLSMPRPTAPTFAANGVGVLPAGTYDYYVSFVRTVAGTIVQESELSPVASHTLAGAFSINLVVPTCSETLLTGVTAQCNGRVIYRLNNTSGDVVRITSGVTIADNVTTAYNDNTPDVNLSTVLADFDYQTTPKSKVFEASGNRLVVADAANPTDVYATQANRPWNVIIDSQEIFDGPVRCLKRVFNALMIGTDRSLWGNNGDFASTESRRISSSVGILNNRCAVEQDNGVLGILSTNKKYFTLTATDFSQNEIRFTDPLSLKIDPIFQQINSADPEIPCMESYTPPNTNKVVISVPLGGSTNNTLIIYNESQAIVKGKPVWQLWNNINASALRQMTINGEISLYSGDYNGFLWNLDNDTLNGDGAEVNGTATGGTTTTLTDATQTWTNNAYVGMIVRGIGGAGEDQFSTITSNTSNTVTFSPAVTTAFNSTTEYTIGGYDVYHFSNWKYVVNSYEFLKQLWFIWVNANASGDYPIQLILQLDFDQTTTNQINLNLNLAAGNTIWGNFIWGAAVWGAYAVFEDRLRQFARFRAIRLGFRNQQAGQPFQINGYALSAQDKKLFFRSAA